jgi:hypothetical protein
MASTGANIPPSKTDFDKIKKLVSSKVLFAHQN